MTDAGLLAAAQVGSVALVGCGRAKRDAPAPASELYTSPGFRLRAAYAEQVADRWFVLSAEHGLVGSDEWISPYELELGGTDKAYRRVWGEWAVARLGRLVRTLRGRAVHVIAPAAYADAIREPLRSHGALLHEPLRGLRQGEQLSWLRDHIIDPEPASVEDSGEPPSTSAPSEQMIARVLLEYRATAVTDDTRLGFAYSDAANELLRDNPFAFLLGVVLDEGIKAERAWEGPYLLKQRLSHLDPVRIRDSRTEVFEAVRRKPALHRYVELMTDAIVAAGARVCDEYDGDASRIWQENPTTREVDARLQRFRRIGPKKAAMAVEMLVTNFGIELTEHADTNVAYDVHVRRVFLRAGLVEHDSFDEVTAAGQRLNPKRPGLLDMPTWLIGRRWCHPTHPQCPDCALTKVCRKRTHLNVSG